MSYSIKIVDTSDPAHDLGLRNVIQAANPSDPLLPEKFLSANLNSSASAKSFFLAAIENGQVIGCNGFLAYDFLLNGADYRGYQSCWSATDPRHQGRKVFTSIIEEAKKIYPTPPADANGPIGSIMAPVSGSEPGQAS